MSYEPPSPDENVVLRQVQGMRREIREVLDRQARVIDLMNRLGERMERGFDDVRRERREVRSDLVLMENRVLTAQSDILRVVVRSTTPPIQTRTSARRTRVAPLRRNPGPPRAARPRPEPRAQDPYRAR